MQLQPSKPRPVTYRRMTLADENWRQTLMASACAVVAPQPAAASGTGMRMRAACAALTGSHVWAQQQMVQAVYADSAGVPTCQMPDVQVSTSKTVALLRVTWDAAQPGMIKCEVGCLFSLSYEALWCHLRVRSLSERHGVC